MSNLLNNLYFHGVINPSLQHNLYLSAMLREANQKDKLNDWFETFTRPDQFYYLENINTNEHPNKKDLHYTSTLNLEKDRFSTVYKENYSAWGHAFRWISAVPLALWDVTVCLIVRVAFILLAYRALDSQSLAYNWMNWYHLGKNFEIAWGRLRGMVNDAKGMEIVHRAYLDKRIYLMAWEQWPFIQTNNSLAFSSESLLNCYLRNSVLADFCIECIWNTVQQKGLNEEDRLFSVENWMVELDYFIDKKSATPYYQKHIESIEQMLEKLEAGAIENTSKFISNNITQEKRCQFLDLLDKKYEIYGERIGEYLEFFEEEEDREALKKDICKFIGLKNSCENKDIKTRFKKITIIIHPDKFDKVTEKDENLHALESFKKCQNVRDVFDKYFSEKIPVENENN